jgi:hypothetical protein
MITMTVSDPNIKQLKILSDIKYCFYINLDFRTDRKAFVEEELTKIGLSSVYQRFNAIKNVNGRIGCSLSHLKCLQMA